MKGSWAAPGQFNTGLPNSLGAWGIKAALRDKGGANRGAHRWPSAIINGRAGTSAKGTGTAHKGGRETSWVLGPPTGGGGGGAPLGVKSHGGEGLGTGPRTNRGRGTLGRD